MKRVLAAASILLAGLTCASSRSAADGLPPELAQIVPGQRGIVCVLGASGKQLEQLWQVMESTELTLYFQSADQEALSAARQAAEADGVLGKRLFVADGDPASIQLEDNLADAIIVPAEEATAVQDVELLRVLRPRAIAVIGSRRLTKPVPEGQDEWSHVYHGPDNNPQSRDAAVRGDFRTQFIAEPTFSPMPEQTVVAGGRIFKAMGHIAHKANQNAMLNTLLCINAYNGTILWRRSLPEGFMIHRNTMIATDDALYMGDDESCKVIDAVTGEIREEIVVPAGHQRRAGLEVDGDEGQCAVRAGGKPGGPGRHAAIGSTRPGALALGHVAGTRLQRPANLLRFRSHDRGDRPERRKRSSGIIATTSFSMRAASA